MVSDRSNTWRWVGLITLLVILLLLWLSGHGPVPTDSSSGCCGQTGKLAEISSPEAPAPETDLAEEAIEAAIAAEASVAAEPVTPPASTSVAPSVPSSSSLPACSADMNVAVIFESGSAILTPDGQQQLDIVAQCIKERTEVGGHSDNTGSAKWNQRLSLQRAQAVVVYMVSKNPTLQDLLTAVGHGSDKPIADNDTSEGRARNRRIEFVVKE